MPEYDHSPRLTQVGIVADAADGGFDYSAVAGEVAENLRVVAGRVNSLHRAAVLEVGRQLNSVKNEIAHGQFLRWVELECHMQPRAAQRAMAAAEMVGKNDKLSYLPADGLRALAARTAPAAVVKEIIGRIEAGEQPTAAAIRGKIAAARRTAKGAAEKPETSLEQSPERRQPDDGGRKHQCEAATKKVAAMLIDCLGERLAECVRLLEQADLPATYHLLRDALQPAAAPDGAPDIEKPEPLPDAS